MPKPPANLTRQQTEQGLNRLKKVLKDVRQFDPANVNDQRNIPATTLSAAIDEALAQTFGTDTADYDRYRRASDLARGVLSGPSLPIADVRRELVHARNRSIGLLKQAIGGLKSRLKELPKNDVDYSVPSAQQKRGELLTLKPGLWGLSVDLKEAARRMSSLWQRWRRKH